MSMRFTREKEANPRWMAPVERPELVSQWAGALARVIYVARSRADVERELTAALDEIVALCEAPLFCVNVAVDVGKRLVDIGFRQADAIQSTVDALGTGLPRLPELAGNDDLAERLVKVIGAVAKGMAEGGSHRLLDEQDGLTRALIHARENAEDALQASEARFEEIFRTSSVGMVISELDGTIVRSNRALGDILEYPKGHVDARLLEDLVYQEDVAYLSRRYESLLADHVRPFRERHRLRRKDGEEALVFLSASVLRDPDGTPRYFVTSAEDVSDKHHLEGQLQFQATHDALTGLVNRNRFTGRLEEALGGNAAADTLTVFHLDLDGFHAVNDGLGRDAGDRLLQVVAGRLRQVVMGEKATVARLEGDEFAILLESTPATPTAASLATRINDELSEPVYLGADGVAATATIAVLDQPPATATPAEILRATSITLHRLKESGRRQWGMVDQDANERDRERYGLASSLPGAWETGEVEVVYQPMVSIVDRQMVAVQALLRWDHGQYGPLDHARVLDVLADTGLGLPIGRWMLGRAADQLKSWATRFDSAPKLYVELTTQVAGDPDLVSTVQAVLADSGLPVEALQLGMPVQSLCMIDGLAEDNLDVLVDIGVPVVLYNFGTTRGDLACLDVRPVRGVKMATNVVSRVALGSALFTKGIRNLVDLVRENGTPVLVGDIETEEQVVWWRAAGADLVQGPYFGDPGTPQHAESLFVA